MSAGKGKKPHRYADFLAKSIARESPPPVNATVAESGTTTAPVSSRNPVKRLLDKEKKNRGVSSSAPSDDDLDATAKGLLNRESVAHRSMDPSVESALVDNLAVSVRQFLMFRF